MTDLQKWIDKAVGSTLQQRVNKAAPQATSAPLSHAVVNAMTGGAADEIAGFAAVTADKLLSLVDLDSGKPAGEVFETERARQEQAIQEIPGAARIPAGVLGAAIGPGAVAGRVLAGAKTAAGGLARGVAIGAGEGAFAGALSAQPGQRAAGAAVGAGVGTILGLAVPLTVGGVRKAVQAATKGGRLSRAQRDAARRVVEALENDDITLDQAQARLKTLGGEAVLADVGEENVKQLAQAVTATAGPGRRQAGRVLEERSRGAAKRVLDAAKEVLSGENADDVATGIIQRRANAARPLYDKALAVGVIDDSQIAKLTSGSAPLKRAIAEAKRLDPDLAQLPDNHMILLDRAYKALGGQANAARVSGDGVKAHSLDSIRTRFRDRLVSLNPAYGDALDTFSSESRLLDALEMGRAALKPKNNINAAAVNALPDGERAMFKVGVADALRDTVERGTDASAARRLLRTPKIRNAIKASFGDDTRAFREFQAQLLREAQFARTASIRFGSRTAPLETETRRLASSAVEGADVLLDAATGQGPLRTLLGVARRRANEAGQLSPDVNRELGRLLFTQGSGTALNQLHAARLRAALQNARAGGLGIGVPTMGLVEGFQ